MKQKTIKYLIYLTIIFGVLTLFFFPKPQKNFIFYILTISIYIIIIRYLLKKIKIK
jgi:hypothetical protein